MSVTWRVGRRLIWCVLAALGACGGAVDSTGLPGPDSTDVPAAPIIAYGSLGAARILLRYSPPYGRLASAAFYLIDGQQRTTTLHVAVPRDAACTVIAPDASTVSYLAGSFFVAHLGQSTSPQRMDGISECPVWAPDAQALWFGSQHYMPSADYSYYRNSHIDPVYRRRLTGDGAESVLELSSNSVPNHCDFGVATNVSVSTTGDVAVVCGSIPDFTPFEAIYIFDQLGGRRLLVSTPASSYIPPDWFIGFRSIAFSPDGQRLAFIDGFIQSPGGPERANKIRIVAVASGSVVATIDQPPGTWALDQMCWADGGRLIAFTALETGGWRSALYVAPSVGGAAVRVSEHAAGTAVVEQFSCAS